MMNYWQKRILEEEAKANAIATKAVAKNKQFLQQANRRLKQEILLLQSEIVSTGEAATRTTLWRYGKYVSLQNDIDEQLRLAGTKQVGLLDDATRKVFENTLNTTLGELVGKTTNFHLLNNSTINQAVRQVWKGADYSTRVWNNTNILATRVKHLVDDMLVLGKSAEELSTALSKEFGVSFSNANRLIRTEISHTFNTASITAYQQANISKVEVLVAKDERLCSVCNEAAGIYDMGQEPTLPIHPRCRCCYAPIIY